MIYPADARRACRRRRRKRSPRQDPLALSRRSDGNSAVAHSRIVATSKSTLLGVALSVAACGSESSPECIPLSGPAVLVEPSAVDFGQVPLGVTTLRSIFVRNTGTSALIFDVEKGSPFEETVFSFSLDGGTTLPPDGVAVLDLEFTPTEMARYVSTLILRTNARDCEGRPRSVEIALAGRGSPDVSVTPMQLDFQSVVIGADATRTLTVANPSDLELSVELEGDPALPMCDAGDDTSAFCLQPSSSVRGGIVTVPPRDSASLDLRFTPRVPGLRSDLRLTLQSCPSEACLQSVDLTGRALESPLRCRPSRLDFGQVDPGRSERSSVACENLSGAPLRIRDWSLEPGSNPAFEMDPARPQELAANATLTIGVVYAPVRLGRVQGTLGIELGDAEGAERVEVPLLGSGGGPALEVSTAELAFGRVAVRAAARKSLIVRNVGYAPLTVSSIEVDTFGTQAFTSPDAHANVLPPGASQTITVEMRPRAAGAVTSALRIVSNDPVAPSVEVPLQAEGVHLPQCQYRVAPAQLDFGVLPVGRAVSRAFEIRNVGRHSCLVSAARLVDANEAFLLESRPLEIAAGAAETLSVEAAPRSEGRLDGQVELSVSSPNQPFVRVKLVGEAAATPLLAAPSEVDFGTLRTGCAPVWRTVTLYNTRDEQVSIAAIDMVAAMDSPSFRLASLPSPLPASPLVLSPGESLAFAIGFEAGAASSFAGGVEITATVDGATRTYVVPVLGRGRGDGRQVDRFQQAEREQVDVLFVVDGSSSMRDEQQALATNLQAFVQFAEAQGLDYHLGVITTSTDEGGRLVSSPPGQSRSSDANGPPELRIVTPETLPSASAVFAANVSLPSVPDGREAGFRTAELALSDPAALEHNAGFLRRDAVLSLIFVSDAPEQSNLLGRQALGSVDYYVDFFRSIKGFRNSDRFSASVITAVEGRCSGPGGTATASGRYLALAERTGGIVQSICTADWSRSLEDLSTAAFGFRSWFYLSLSPIPSTIEVFVNGEAQPQTTARGAINWFYETTAGALSFAPFSTPEPGSEVRVEYQTDCR